MKRQMLRTMSTLAASTTIAFFGAMISTHSADAATPTDENTELQNARQTQIICRPNQGDPLGRQCHQGNR